MTAVGLYIRECSFWIRVPGSISPKAQQTCKDFKRVYAPLPFYITRVHEIIEDIGKAKIISKLYLSKGYYQVKVKERDREQTAYVCHRGKFEVTQTIKKYMGPTTKKGLHSFLGTISYYRKFIKNLAKQTAVLTLTTYKAAPPRVDWSNGIEQAFSVIYQLLSNACKLLFHCHAIIFLL